MSIIETEKVLADNKRMRDILMLIVDTVGIGQPDYEELEWDWEMFEFFMPAIEKWYNEGGVNHGN